MFTTPFSHLGSLWSSFTGIWESDEFRIYLLRRGYRTSNDWPFFRRAFLESWAQPGFHRFWRVWNPGLGFLTFRMYRVIGGNRRGHVATILTFLGSGMAHSLLVLPALGWSYTIPVTFSCFGILASAGPALSRLLGLASWPALANAALNAALVIACFSLGFRADEVLRCWQ